MAKLIVMIGISGSGKSTVADKIAKENNAIVYSADKIREELYSSADVLGDGRVVFGILSGRIKKSLSNGENVIIDNTNVTSSARKSLLKLDNVDNRIAYVIDCSVEQAMNNQKNRTRKVPQEVIEKQFVQFNKDKSKIVDEFDDVIYPKELLNYNEVV